MGRIMAGALLIIGGIIICFIIGPVINFFGGALWAYLFYLFPVSFFLSGLYLILIGLMYLFNLQGDSIG
jgi:hypothetical protein